MAAQITHIVFADKIFNILFPNRNRRNFFVGTCFPDIRYLDVIGREKTHANDIKIRTEDTDFVAGVKFHRTLDLIRENYMINSGVYKIIPESDMVIRALKLFEDKQYYSHTKKWAEYSEYFDNILVEETNYGIAPSNIERWHKILKKYFTQPPNPDSITEFAANLGLSSEKIVSLNEMINDLGKNKKIVGIVDSFYENFEGIIKKEI